VLKPVHESLVYRRQDYLDRCSRKAPSSLAQPNKNHGVGFWYEGCPSEATTVPVTLLHPVFNEFIEDCDSYQLTREDHAFALDLAHAMSKVFQDDKERQKIFIDICQKHGLSFTSSQIAGTEFTTDGDMRCNSYLYCLGVMKNEAGSKGAVFEAGLYYTAYLKHLDGAVQLNSSLPCLALYLIGEVSVSRC
jgi:hypothetical protein